MSTYVLVKKNVLLAVFAVTFSILSLTLFLPILIYTNFIKPRFIDRFILSRLPKTLDLPSSHATTTAPFKSKSVRPQSIAIIGGNLSACLTAHILTKAGHSVEIFESSNQLACETFNTIPLALPHPHPAPTSPEMKLVSPPKRKSASGLRKNTSSRASSSLSSIVEGDEEDDAGSTPRDSDSPTSISPAPSSNTSPQATQSANQTAPTSSPQSHYLQEVCIGLNGGYWNRLLSPNLTYLLRKFAIPTKSITLTSTIAVAAPTPSPSNDQPILHTLKPKPAAFTSRYLDELDANQSDQNTLKTAALPAQVPEPSLSQLYQPDIDTILQLIPLIDRVSHWAELPFYVPSFFSACSTSPSRQGSPNRFHTSDFIELNKLNGKTMPSSLHNFQSANILNPFNYIPISILFWFFDISTSFYQDFFLPHYSTLLQSTSNVHSLPSTFIPLLHTIKPLDDVSNVTTFDIQPPRLPHPSPSNATHPNILNPHPSQTLIKQLTDGVTVHTNCEIVQIDASAFRPTPSSTPNPTQINPPHKKADKSGRIKVHFGTIQDPVSKFDKYTNTTFLHPSLDSNPTTSTTPYTSIPSTPLLEEEQSLIQLRKHNATGLDADYLQYRQNFAKAQLQSTLLPKHHPISNNSSTISHGDLAAIRSYDRVVFATHNDTILNTLTPLNPLQRFILSNTSWCLYDYVYGIVHSDENIIPPRLRNPRNPHLHNTSYTHVKQQAAHVTQDQPPQYNAQSHRYLTSPSLLFALPYLLFSEETAVRVTSNIWFMSISGIITAVIATLYELILRACCLCSSSTPTNPASTPPPSKSKDYLLNSIKHSPRKGDEMSLSLACSTFLDPSMPRPHSKVYEHTTILTPFLYPTAPPPSGSIKPLFVTFNLTQTSISLPKIHPVGCISLVRSSIHYNLWNQLFSHALLPLIQGDLGLYFSSPLFALPFGSSGLINGFSLDAQVVVGAVVASYLLGDRAVMDLYYSSDPGELTVEPRKQSHFALKSYESEDAYNDFLAFKANITGFHR
jgi:hypothetical protein